MNKRIDLGAMKLVRHSELPLKGDHHHREIMEYARSCESLFSDLEMEEKEVFLG